MQKSIEKAEQVGRPPWALKIAQNLLEDVMPFSRLPGGSSSSRGASTLLSTIEALRASDYNFLHEHDLDKLACAAQRVLPHRVSGSLPEKAAIVKPEDILDEPFRSQFLAMPQEIPITDRPIAGDLPRACHLVSKEDQYNLNNILLQRGVCRLVPLDKCIFDSKGKVVAGGLFTVKHKEGSDRLINDRRPFNAMERRLNWARLPHGTMLTQLIVGKGSGDQGMTFAVIFLRSGTLQSGRPGTSSASPLTARATRILGAWKGVCTCLVLWWFAWGIATRLTLPR